MKHLPRLLLLAAIATLSSCASGISGSGENGAWTPRDTESTVAAINGVANAYNQVRYPAPPQVYQQPIAAPIVPVQPLYRGY